MVCLVLVLAITSLSAFLRLSKAGLSCADWPRCYGQNLREQQQGLVSAAGESDATARARLAHRVVASTALLLVCLMVIACFAEPPVLWRQGRIALALLALALFLAVLGRWSANARIPAVAIGNLLGGFAMLALCWRLAHAGATGGPAGLRLGAALGLLLLGLQAALGALVSASHASMACDGLVDCMVAAARQPWSVLDPWREPLLASVPPINAAGALANTVHQLGGYAVAAVVLPLGLAALRHGRAGAGMVLLALLALQLGLGWLLAGPALSLALALAHNVVAALLLSTAFELTRGNPATVTA